jgi:hypothetical protein
MAHGNDVHRVVGSRDWRSGLPACHAAWSRLTMSRWVWLSQVPAIFMSGYVALDLVKSEGVGADRLCPPPHSGPDRPGLRRCRQRLDQMDGQAFAGIGLGQQDVARLRERLAAWRRNARDADREPRTSDQAGHRTTSEQTPAVGGPEPGIHESESASRRQHQPGSEPAAQAGRDDPEAEP